MSPEIFIVKWERKLDKHIMEGRMSVAVEEVSLSTPDEITSWLTAMLEDGFQLLSLILFAEREAKSVGIVGKAAKEAPMLSVWEKMELCKMMIGAMIQKFREAKSGSFFYGMMRWQELPIALRRRINDFIEAVGALKANGKWTDDRAGVVRALERLGSPRETVEYVDELYFRKRLP